MESLDLTTDVEKGTCESGSTYMSLLRFWLEVGGNKEDLKLNCGFQSNNKDLRG